MAQRQPPHILSSETQNDDELYFGNLTRLIDMQPLDQDLADVYERMNKPNDGSVFHTYLAAVHERISRLNDEE